MLLFLLINAFSVHFPSREKSFAAFTHVGVILFISFSVVLIAVVTSSGSFTHRLCVQVLWGLFSWSDFIRLPVRKG